MHGAHLTVFPLTSEVLRGNPLGDPPERFSPLLVPAGGGRGLPLVVILVGYTGFGHKVLNRPSLWEENLPERIARGVAEGRIPPAVFLWPSCETRLGGSQYLNSAGTGRYEDFLCDELVPAVERKLGCGGSGRRAVAGKSSGGYGALRLAMRRPGLFAAAASHAGDIGFDLSHPRGFPDALNCWREHGGPAAFLARLPDLELGFAEHAGVELIAMASCYSPNPAAPLGVDLPVDPETGEMRPEVFARWLENDPLRMVERPECAEALRSLRALWLDAGEKDEFALQWGLRRFLRRLEALGIPHRAEFFPGGHFRIDHRYERSLPFLLEALV
ncbi:MAG: hypothetical protein D6702_12335 [Planctomycetota bacterium]|nr:MAG: hypothetical protein D6702_12335 [Planctomycetota bacterium]